MPAVCGDAIDVPEMRTPSTPVPTPADKMATPGAMTSGFGASSPRRGPKLLKLAGAVKAGFGVLGPFVIDAICLLTMLGLAAVADQTDQAD